MLIIQNQNSSKKNNTASLRFQTEIKENQKSIGSLKHREIVKANSKNQKSSEKLHCTEEMNSYTENTKSG